MIPIYNSTSIKLATRLKNPQTKEQILVFCIIILSNIIDQILNLNSGLLMITIFYYIANEGLSIVENCAEMGILIPDEIGEKLKVIRNNDKGDKHE